MIFDNIENEIPGYKYLLAMYISINGPFDDNMNGPDHICIADTRDECVEKIKEILERNLKINTEKLEDKTRIYYDEPNITRLGADVHWHDKDGDKSWWWMFNVYPVQYLNKKTEE